MPLLGNPLAKAFSAIPKQTITGNGTVGPYTLDYSAGGDQDIEVYVNNVRQEPGVAYTVAGTSLTMTGTVASSDDFYVVFQGSAQQTVTPAAGSVTDSMIVGMTSSKLSGALPAIDGSALTSLSSSALTGALPALDGSALTGVSAGKLLQFASDQSANTTSSSTIPQDNTTPTNTEGTEVFSIAFTPTASDSTLLLQASFQLSASANTKYGIWTLFEDSTCIGSWSCPLPYSNNGNTASFNVVRSASSTSARTYSVRAGLASGTSGTIYIGDVYSNNYGALNANYMTIQEIGA